MQQEIMEYPKITLLKNSLNKLAFNFTNYEFGTSTVKFIINDIYLNETILSHTFTNEKIVQYLIIENELSESLLIGDGTYKYSLLAIDLLGNQLAITLPSHVDVLDVLKDTTSEEFENINEFDIPLDDIEEIDVYSIYDFSSLEDVKEMIEDETLDRQESQLGMVKLIAEVESFIDIPIDTALIGSVFIVKDEDYIGYLIGIGRKVYKFIEPL